MPFQARTDRRERLFKKTIVGVTVLCAAALLVGTPSGRHVTALAGLRARSTAARVLALEPSREDRDAEWRLMRQRGIEHTHAIYRDFYEHEAEPDLRLILETAGMAPDEVLLRWANYDWTVAFSPQVFEADDTGRAYRFRPGTRAGWMRDGTLPKGMSCFFLLADTPEIRRAMADAGRQFLPNTMQTTNSWGLRGPEPDLSAPVRGLVIGDSFMQGVLLPDDKTPPALLEQYLTDALGRRVAIVNTGHIGYSIEQYERTFLEYIDRVRPQFVIVSICYNDFGNGFDVVDGRAGDWDEGKYWLNRIQQHCRSRSVVCIICPVPLERQVCGPRKEGHYPGRVSDIAAVTGPYFVNATDAFSNEHLRLLTEGIRHHARPPSSPLFNGHLQDDHFSSLGSALWARVVGRRVALLLETKDASEHEHHPSRARTTLTP